MQKHLAIYFFIIVSAFPLLLFPNQWSGVAFVVMAAAWVGLRRRQKRPWFATLLPAPIVILLLTATIAMVAALDPALAAKRYWNIMLQVSTYLLILQLVELGIELRRLVQFFLGATAILTGITFLTADWSLVRLLPLPFYDHMPSLLPFLSRVADNSVSGVNPRVVGGTFSFVTPFLIGYALQCSQARWRWVALWLAFCACVLIVLSQAPMGVLGVTVGLIVIAGLRFRLVRWVCLAVSLLLTAVLLVADLSRLWNPLLDMQHPIGIAMVLRIDMWRQAIAMLHDMPFTGIGLNNFPVMLTNFYHGYLIGPEVHAHNFYLQTALDLGLFGLAAVVWFFGRFLLSMLRSQQSPYQPLLHGCAASVIAYLASGLFDSQVTGQKPVIFLWAILGLGAAALAKTAPHAHQSARRSLPLALAACLTILIIFPTARQRNRAVLTAQHSLIGQSNWRPSSATSLSALDSALISNNNNPRLYSLRAQLYDKDEQPEQALADWQQRVNIDQRNSTARYAPFLRWQQPAQTVELDAVYRQWRLRYPLKAEPYILSALAQANSPAAVDLATEGLATGAQPPSTLILLKKRR